MITSQKNNINITIKMACRYQRNANTSYNHEQFIYACTWSYTCSCLLQGNL